MNKNTIITIGISAAAVLLTATAIVVWKTSSKGKSAKTGKKLSGKSKVLVIGDSTTAIDWSYGDLLKDNNVIATMVKKAKNGASTTWMRDQIVNELNKEKYDAIFMLGGYNDITNEMNLDTTQINVNDIVNAAKAKGSMIVLITPAPAGLSVDSSHTSSWIKNRQDRINSIIKNSNATAVIDLYSKILDKDNKPQLKYVLSASNPHINQAAQQIIFDEIKKMIKN
jgi:lysophospholipase L1-like esterase